MPDIRARDPDQLRAIPINLLRIPGDRRIGLVLGESEAHDVGPLLHFLDEIGVGEGCVDCTVVPINLILASELKSGMIAVLGRWER